jgi:hypothetical protein
MQIFVAKENSEFSDFPLIILRAKKSNFFVFLCDGEYTVERVSRKCLPHNSALHSLYKEENVLSLSVIDAMAYDLIKHFLSFEKF